MPTIHSIRTKESKNGTSRYGHIGPYREYIKIMKRFYLSDKDKKIGGVCGGLAEYFDIDPLIVRITMFALIWCGMLSVWIYLLIWLLAPRKYNF